jgi:NAD(P)-dependent dehydrogenase (short-subunit alcohol dehydrogenase family)
MILTMRFRVTNILTIGRDLTMDINVKGVWYGCKHAILAMRQSGGGSIINTASFVALMGAATPQLACKVL